MYEHESISSYRIYDIVLADIIQMSNKSAWIGVTTQKYRQFTQKVSLTDDAKLQVNRLINELHIIALIYPSLTSAHQTLLDEQLQNVGRLLDQKMKGQGWMAYFSKSSQVITLEELWKSISNFTEDAHQRLIDDVCILKGYRQPS